MPGGTKTGLSSTNTSMRLSTGVDGVTALDKETSQTRIDNFQTAFKNTNKISAFEVARAVLKLTGALTEDILIESGTEQTLGAIENKPMHCFGSCTAM